MTRLAEWTMLSHGWRRFALLVVAGALAGLSVPPLFVLPALFVTLPLWVWALDGAERRPGLGRLFGPAFAIGFAFGWGYFTVAFHWLGAAFLLEGGWFLALMPFAILALAALIALFWGLASAAAHLFWSHGASPNMPAARCFRAFPSTFWATPSPARPKCCSSLRWSASTG
jgi:apolipoprotein N-acyltransferase